MINPIDLRINNWVAYQATDTSPLAYHRVSEIGSRLVMLKGGSPSKRELLYPVRLTAELLVKNKFLQSDKAVAGSWVFQFPELELPDIALYEHKEGNGVWMFAIDTGSGNYFNLTFILHVHQLQNLVLDIYGKELKFEV